MQSNFCSRRDAQYPACVLTAVVTNSLSKRSPREHLSTNRHPDSMKLCAPHNLRMITEAAAEAEASRVASEAAFSRGERRKRRRAQQL